MPTYSMTRLSCSRCRTTHIRKNKQGEWKCYECLGKPTIVPLNKIAREFTWNKRRKSKQLIVPSKAELVGKINAIPDLRLRAFFSMLYLSGCRISELLGLPKKKITGIRKVQVTMEKLDSGKDVMLLNNIPILKRKELMPKVIPIVVEKELDLVVHIQDYLNTLQDDDFLFTFNRKKAWLYCKQHMIDNLTGESYHPHMFRHFRITHLAKPPYHFNDGELVQFIGWSDSRPATTYAHLDWKHNADKMSK